MTGNEWMLFFSAVGLGFALNMVGAELHDREQREERRQMLDVPHPYGPSDYPMCQIELTGRQFLLATGHIPREDDWLLVHDEAFLSWPWLCGEIARREGVDAIPKRSAPTCTNPDPDRCT